MLTGVTTVLSDFWLVESLFLTDTSFPYLEHLELGAGCRNKFGISSCLLVATRQM